ncbi:MAG TPA: hypothetical protein VNB54_06820 [Alphaproteobacteria bacterium]|nr:hypothetical protein [Alphaproteobacteria bacterium]
MAGSFQANGSGNLVSGTMDINNSSGVSTNVPFTGTYSVVPNGQGSATLTSAIQTFNIHFVIISSKRALLTRFDNSSVGHGAIDLQNPAAFSAAGIQAQFAYQLTGIDSGANPLATVGGFTTDGAGAVPAGLHDVSDNGTPIINQPLTGTYTVAGSANGRGTLALNTSLGTLHFAFYIVAANSLKLVETERTPALAGEALGGFNATTSVAGCGPCVFAWNGFSGSIPFAAAGIYFINANNGIPSGTADINLGGSVSTSALSGAYSFAPQFRGTASFGSVAGAPATFAVYAISGGWLTLQIDPGKVITGLAFIQALAGTPHLDLSFDGSYGFNFVGATFNAQTDEVGQITTHDTNSSGAGAVTGVVDINNAGVPISGVGVSGSFTMDKTAFGTITMQTSNGVQHFRLHATGGFGPVFFVSADSNLVASGIFEMQGQ